MICDGLVISEQNQRRKLRRLRTDIQQTLRVPSIDLCFVILISIRLPDGSIPWWKDARVASRAIPFLVLRLLGMVSQSDCLIPLIRFEVNE